ncbi:MAG TPA: tRNA pseudouridine(55) synthase TruB [Desulfuromonadales bacterium]
MNGILLIDKPQGMTSHDVVRRVRRLLRTRRVGHTGTLDPLATGVLPVAVGEATRIVQFLMEGDKTYRAVLKLGETMTTQDAEGEVLERRPVAGITAEAVMAAGRSFVGVIRQLPPMYSALKKDGVPLYRLARQGIEVERESREVRIDRLQILAVDLPLITLEVDCSKGTYVRTLCHDFGLALGTGAHLVALRRTRSGTFTEADCVTLEQLETDDAAKPPLLSVTEALAGMPALEIDAEAARRLADGIPPTLASLATAPGCPEGATVRLLHDGILLAVARFAPGRLSEKRGDFELLRVFQAARAA